MPTKSKLPTTTGANPAPLVPDLRRMRRPPTHPGEMLLKEFLEPADVSQRQAAIRMGMSYNRLSEIVLGKRGVTPETAILFGLLTKTDPRVWLQLQLDYDLWHEMQKTKGITVEALA